MVKVGVTNTWLSVGFAPGAALEVRLAPGPTIAATLSRVRGGSKTPGSNALQDFHKGSNKESPGGKER